MEKPADNNDKKNAPTPVMAQYLTAKENHPDAIVLFRMGDFYETFFDDAKTAAAALDIALTKRGQHNGEEIPMAGVPAHSVEGYLAKLVRLGYKIAICDQLETPEEAKKRGYKAVVRRDVTRIITKGTITEENLLDAKSNNRLAAIVFALGGLEAALAWADVSTGEFCVTGAHPQRLIDDAAGLSIGEILILDRDYNRPFTKSLATICGSTTIRPNLKADFKSSQKLLCEGLGVQTLSGFGDFSKLQIEALGLLYDYIISTQAGNTPKLSPPAEILTQNYLAIDAATRLSLEIEKSQKNIKAATLIGTIDKTKTPHGGRLLLNDISLPLIDKKIIEARYDAISYWLENQNLIKEFTDLLADLPDMARPLSRLELNRGGPRDLAAISKTLKKTAQISLKFTAKLPEVLENIKNKTNLHNSVGLSELSQYLGKFLAEELPFLTREGGFVKSGFDPALDEYITLRDSSRRLINELTAKVSEIAGQPLKIKYNNILGYFIEATPKQAPPLFEAPLNQTFIHRQTLAGMVRFTTNELIELNSKTARAAELALSRELELFEIARIAISANAHEIRQLNDALARLDVCLSGAIYASDNDCCRPILTQDTQFQAQMARHAVVDAALRAKGGIFTANDCNLDGDGELFPRFNLITGPNMAGKSTFLRQNALLIILAQAGQYVPAQSLKLGIVDRLFSRVGAADDLYSGQSTFMVEMVETAAILNRATAKSFVILDEIGRGTATYDGLAIAWSVTEYLHEINKSRTLFATHYHELTSLAGQLNAIGNLCLEVKEWDGDLVFIHKVISGAADRSYGVQVAKLAGLPQVAVNRAKEVLEKLENEKSANNSLHNDLPLFSSKIEQKAEIKLKSELELIIEEIDPNNITPIQALDLLYQLKTKL